MKIGTFLFLSFIIFLSACDLSPKMPERVSVFSCVVSVSDNQFVTAVVSGNPDTASIEIKAYKNNVFVEKLKHTYSGDVDLFEFNYEIYKSVNIFSADTILKFVYSENGEERMIYEGYIPKKIPIDTAFVTPFVSYYNNHSDYINNIAFVEFTDASTTESVLHYYVSIEVYDSVGQRHFGNEKLIKDADVKRNQKNRIDLSYYTRLEPEEQTHKVYAYVAVISDDLYQEFLRQELINERKQDQMFFDNGMQMQHFSAFPVNYGLFAAYSSSVDSITVIFPDTKP